MIFWNKSRKKLENEILNSNVKSYSQHFVKVYDNWKDYHIRQSDKILLATIDYSCYLNNDKCNWSTKALSEHTGLSIRQVNDSIINLEDRQLITREHRGNKKILRSNSDQDGTFLKLYTDLLRVPSQVLSINDKFIYTAIHHLCGDTGNGMCYPPNSYLAQRVGCTLPTVARSIENLEKKGMIAVNENGNGIREISIAIEAWSSLIKGPTVLQLMEGLNHEQIEAFKERFGIKTDFKKSFREALIDRNDDFDDDDYDDEPF